MSSAPAWPTSMRNIARLLADLNERTMRSYGKSRRQLFEELDRWSLRPLPQSEYAYAEWKKARVNLDYHVELARHYYSVPHALVHQAVELRHTQDTVEIFERRARRHASQEHCAWSLHDADRAHAARASGPIRTARPSSSLSWARTVGPMTETLCEKIMADRPHPEQGYRSCLGLIRLAKRFGRERVEAVCTRALVDRGALVSLGPQHPENGLDRASQFEESSTTAAPVAVHEHLRGPGYYR